MNNCRNGRFFTLTLSSLFFRTLFFVAWSNKIITILQRNSKCSSVKKLRERAKSVEIPLGFACCFCIRWCLLLNETCLPHSFVHIYWTFVECLNKKKKTWNCMTLYSFYICSRLFHRRIIVSKILIPKTLNLDSPTTLVMKLYCISCWNLF